MVLNMGPLDWESSALTTGPLLHDSTYSLCKITKWESMKRNFKVSNTVIVNQANVLGSHYLEARVTGASSGRKGLV